MGLLSGVEGVREDLVADIRDRIERGDYLTEDKLNEAIHSLLLKDIMAEGEETAVMRFNKAVLDAGRAGIAADDRVRRICSREEGQGGHARTGAERSPSEYKDERITLTVYFNAEAEDYNQYYTEFHKRWVRQLRRLADGREVCTLKRDFQRCYPHFFVQSADSRRAERPARISSASMRSKSTAMVKHVFQGRPYIEVFEIDTVGRRALGGGRDHRRPSRRRAYLNARANTTRPSDLLRLGGFERRMS